MKLNPQHYTLKELLSGRLFHIPDYQRAYSWTSRQRKDLFGDIQEVYESPQRTRIILWRLLLRSEKASP